ncbi:MAG TPA: hypothetical protein DCM05_05715, partial [Elusimicrobia bacterium]|nr:hypothetical protein [Elusimicrobiota bacterium]
MKRPFTRLVSLSLAVLIPTSALAQTVPGSLASAPLGAASAAVGASGAALSQRFVSAINFHLDSSALSLPVSPSLSSVQPVAPARYLAQAALATAPQAKTLSAGSQAARFLTAALVDPVKRAAAVAALRAQGAEGVAAAEKIEQLAPAVSGLESLRKLNEDFQRGPAEGRLAQFFSGSRSTPEEFASYAERLFHPGLTQGNAAVAYRLQKTRPEAAAGVPYGFQAPSGTGERSTPAPDQELHDEVALSPLTNAERERAVVELFKQAGASPEEIKLQDAGRGHNNIYVVKKGKTDRVVVVGGHHDKVEGDGGYGLIDNWTGAAMVTNLYQALRDADTEATYVFIAFAREEEGLIGSSRYLEALSKQEKLKI